MTVRGTTIEDLETLTRVRVDFMKELWPERDPVEVEGAWQDTEEWIRRMINEERLLGYFLYEGEVLATAASLLLYELPPKPGGVRRVNGHVLNVFTYPEFRRRGYGRRMMEHLVAEGRARGLFQLELHATPDGEPLYRQLGFAEPDSPWLELVL